MTDDWTGLSPRELTLREQKRADLYSFWSPRLGRLVQVAGALPFLRSLHLEFDSTIAVYCERPRKLKVGDSLIELSFAVASPTGAVRYELVAAASDEVIALARQARRRREIERAALESAVALDVVTQSALVSRSVESSAFLQLLPDVQAAVRMPDLSGTTARVIEILTLVPALSCHQLISSLPEFHPARVRCAIAQLAHAGKATIEFGLGLSMHNLVRRRA